LATGHPTGLIDLVSERRTGFSEIDITLQFFSRFRRRGTNGRIPVRDRDGAMTENARKRRRVEGR
jgi:hypothetical protein